MENGKDEKGKKEVKEEQEELVPGTATGSGARNSSSERVRAHASEHPTMVMVDEATGNRYMRAVEHKGLGGEGDESWLVENLSACDAILAKVFRRKARA